VAPRRCLGLVAQAYDWQASVINTAFQAAQIAITAGKMSTNRNDHPTRRHHVVGRLPDR